MGAFDEVQGKVKEAAGDLTDNEAREQEGKAQKQKGEAEREADQARVEAKAHESELDWKGKRALNAETDSPQAWANDGRIRAAIAEARDWFSQVAGLTTLTADSHYQLASRLASAYKVASVGVPVVLLYLGFTGDTYFKDGIRDADHWQQLMRGYLHGVVPPDLPGRELAHESGGSLTFLVGALPVREVSQPPSRESMSRGNNPRG